MAQEKLNILHIDPEKKWRGGQQQVYYLHEALVKKGFNSTLICNPSSELQKKCNSNNLPFKTILMLGEIDIISAIRISQFCRKNKISIIHSHSAHAITIGILVKLFYSKVKLIAVKRVDFPIKKNIFSKIKYNNKRIDKIVCISEFIKSVLINDGISEEKLLTIRSGVDISKFANVFPDSDFKVSLGVKKDSFLIGTVAAFAGHKDYPNLINSFREVKDKINNLTLCCIGDGPIFENIKKQAKDLNLEKDIIFTGFRIDIGIFLKSFDLFVLASKKEGLGTSLIDAMAVGLPIVSTNTGGIPELIKNGENGILVDPQNPTQLANAIIDLINNSDKRNKLSENSLRYANEFSIETTINKNISLYKSLIDA